MMINDAIKDNKQNNKKEEKISFNVFHMMNSLLLKKISLN